MFVEAQGGECEAGKDRAPGMGSLRVQLRIQRIHCHRTKLREVKHMAEKNGAAEGISGVVEGVKGKVKEAAGAVTGRDDLRREGEAQQDKADAQREAAQKEAEAAGARSAADANEQRQKAQQ